MGQIIFKNICKSFGETKVIENLNLTIEDGKFTVLIGSSGCGKTTLLRIIAGIGPATSGEIFIDGKEVSNVAPSKRDIAMVFQNYAIYPTMTVRENIEFGLKNRKVPKEERERLITECAEIVGMTPYLNRKPNELSGGQRQRIALARAMVKKPAVFLMDEPLSNLDAKLRAAMRVELKELHKRLGSTFVYVTHDQIEAMSMADTIVLMEKGVIQQIGTPEEMYNDPVNVFTARFIGTPPMNIIKLAGDGSQLGFRPEKIMLSYEKPAEQGYTTKGKIVTREMLGDDTQYKVICEDLAFMVKIPDQSFHTDEEVFVHVNTMDMYFFDSADLRIREDNPKFEECKILACGGLQ
ncbi:MAG: ABC transporter ATP-binding protein [Spirochaetales bacterium]|nr:ABC transporter ATP-binding protein [Spirochaetales bacterium]